MKIEEIKEAYWTTQKKKEAYGIKILRDFFILFFKKVLNIAIFFY